MQSYVNALILHYHVEVLVSGVHYHVRLLVSGVVFMSL